jgi:hypothetical protein
MLTTCTRWIALLAVAAALLAPARAGAQGVGSGPLTETLIDTDPTTGFFAMGRIKFAPGLTIDELGYDSNVFDEHDEPNGDYVMRTRPDLSVYSALRFARVSAYAGSDLAYYRDYERERSVGHLYRARVDLLLSRFQPYFGGGRTRTRTRPNGEIDVRADQQHDELSGGLAFALGPHQTVFLGTTQFSEAYKDGLEDGIDLPTTLNHTSHTYTTGVRTDITPITTLTITANFTRDRFESRPLRDSESKVATADLRIGSEAMIGGVVSLSYHDNNAVDPLIERFRGMTGQAVLTYSFLEVGRLTAAFTRGLQYSFDEAEALYLENSLSLSYTHRLFGDVDLQARASRSLFDYGFRQGVPPHQDRLDSAGASIGYNLRNRTRVSANYEVTERTAPAFPLRNYDRVRIYLSWLYAF